MIHDNSYQKGTLVLATTLTEAILLGDL